MNNVPNTLGMITEEERKERRKSHGLSIPSIATLYFDFSSSDYLDMNNSIYKLQRSLSLSPKPTVSSFSLTQTGKFAMSKPI
jgi:hypothetical protein